MMATTHEPDPDDAADDELAAERAGQSTTVEEAMDAAKTIGDDGEPILVQRTGDHCSGCDRQGGGEQVGKAPKVAQHKYAAGQGTDQEARHWKQPHGRGQRRRIEGADEGHGKPSQEAHCNEEPGNGPKPPPGFAARLKFVAHVAWCARIL